MTDAHRARGGRLGTPVMGRIVPLLLLLAGMISLGMAALSYFDILANDGSIHVVGVSVHGKTEHEVEFSGRAARDPTSTPISMDIQSHGDAHLVLRTPVIPAHIIKGVPIGKQVRHLNCEFQAAADLASYYGVDLSWKEIFLAVGVDPNGDPSKGFVGASMDDEPGHVYPRGYGVYALPLAKGLRSFGLNAHPYENANVEWLKSKILNDQPVVVWTTYDMYREKVRYWKTEDGKKIVRGVPWEHTYTAVGFDAGGIYLDDPVTAKRKYFDWKDFERGWSYLNDMALTIEPPFLLNAGKGRGGRKGG